MASVDEKTPAAAPAAVSAAAPASAPAPAPIDAGNYLGTHLATCDGCTANPIVGFRYKCTKCPDHDVCENCYDSFQKGKFVHENKINPVSRDVKDHAFAPYVDKKKFTGLLPKKKEPTAKKEGKKPKPNEECHCGSKKKYKKCCFAKDSA